MFERFYQYRFLGGRLIGSENPELPGNPQQIAERMVGQCGVRTIISLTPAQPRLVVPELRQLHLPIKGTPDRSEIEQAVEMVTDGLMIGGVWVHCQQGIDRTGCVIGSYLASTGVPADDAIARVYSCFPARRQHPRMIELWEPYRRLIRSFSKRMPVE